MSRSVLSWLWSSQRTATASHLRHPAPQLLWQAGQPNICQPEHCGDGGSEDVGAETRKYNFQFSTKQTNFHLTSGVHLDSWCYVMTHSAVSQVKGYRSGPKDQKTSVVIFVKVKIVDSHSFFFFSYWPLHFPIFFNFLSVTPPKTVWYHLRTSVGTLSHRISTTVPLSYTSATHFI